MTDTELEVLQKIADGEDYREIGKQMNFCPEYVKRLSHSAQTFLGADNRAHAVALALRRGLIK
jgi:DNA-binding CsgD family transcriptional regulator